MAKMHPEKLPPNATDSERDFFEACRKLPDKYHVFYSLRWHSRNEDTGLREDSECDFLVYNPDYGYLCLEVKGGSGIDEDDGIWTLQLSRNAERNLRCSPYIQAEQSTRFIKKYFEEETESKFSGVFGYAVAFPFFNVTSQLAVDAPLELTIDMSAIRGDLHKKITDIFKYFKSVKGQATFLSQSNKDKFVSIINKRVVLSIAAGSLIHHKERELQDINKIQDAVIDCLTNYKKAFIVGGAGTGKTWIGIKKIKRAMAEGKRTLFLCYNKALAEYVSGYLGDRSSAYTFDSFAYRILGSDADKAIVKCGQREYFDLLSKAENIPQFDLIVVDEAQDFSEDWAVAVNLFLASEDSSLYVFYDESQNIFGRHFGDKFLIDNKPFILRYNIRNTAQIYKWTTDNTSEGRDTIPNEIEGALPEERSFTSKQKLIAYLNSTLNRLIEREGVSTNSIVILSNLKKENSVLSGIDSLGQYSIITDRANPNRNEVAYRTIQGFKGLESDIVIFINETTKGVPQSEATRMTLYTAYTRAKYFLYVVNFQKGEDSR